jgi:hypothetical protein
MENVHDIVKELERVNDSLEFDECLKVSERRALLKRFSLLKKLYNYSVGVKFQAITKWDSSKRKFIKVGKSHLHTSDCPCPQCVDSDLPIPYLPQR